MIQALVEIGETFDFFYKGELAMGDSIDISHGGKKYGSAVICQINGKNKYGAVRTA